MSIRTTDLLGSQTKKCLRVTMLLALMAVMIALAVFGLLLATGTIGGTLP